jgi:hypothetical protein
MPEQIDELAPPHSITSPRPAGHNWLAIEGWHTEETLLRRAISTRLMTAEGHVWTAPD